MESGSSNGSSNQSTIKRPASMYERRLVPTVAKGQTDVRNTTSMYQMAGDGKPFGEEVKVRSDLVTRCLKELIRAMQPVPEDQKQSIAPHGELIRSAVTDLIALYANLVRLKEFENLCSSQQRFKDDSLILKINRNSQARMYFFLPSTTNYLIISSPLMLARPPEKPSSSSPART